MPDSALEISEEVYYSLQAVLYIAEAFIDPETLGLVSLLQFLGDIAGINLDIQRLLSWLTGKPHTLDTLNVAHELMQSQIPAVKALGFHWTTGAINYDYVLSSQIDSDTWFMPARAFVLQVMGVQHLDFYKEAFDRIVTGQSDHRELDRLYRPQDFGYPRKVSRWEFEQQHHSGQLNEWLFQHFNRFFIHQDRPYIPPTVIIPPPPPPPPILPPGNCQDPCSLAIISAIGRVSDALGKLPSGSDSPALTRIAQCLCPALESVAQAIEGIESPDLSGVAAALDGLAVKLDALNSIATAIGTQKPTDVSGIVAELKRLADDVERRDPNEAAEYRAFLDKAAQERIIDPNIAQIFRG